MAPEPMVMSRLVLLPRTMPGSMVLLHLCWCLWPVLPPEAMRMLIVWPATWGHVGVQESCWVGSVCLCPWESWSQWQGQGRAGYASGNGEQAPSGSLGLPIQLQCRCTFQDMSWATISSTPPVTSWSAWSDWSCGTTAMRSQRFRAMAEYPRWVLLRVQYSTSQLPWIRTVTHCNKHL